MTIPLTITVRTEPKAEVLNKSNFLYLALRALFKVSTKVYFRKIIVENKAVIPKDVPLILVSNHPSAFMDPILLGSILPQECIFLARGEAFKKKLGSFMMHKMNALPVYREDASPDKVHLNRDTFRKSFELLNHGKTLFYFPEGISKTEPRLRPMKKGLARLAFNYAEENNWQKDVCLLPVALSYSDPHTFRSKVTIQFGEPFKISQWKENYENSKPRAIAELTDKFRSQLQGLSIFIPDEKNEPLARKVEELLGFWNTSKNKAILEKLNAFNLKFDKLSNENPNEASKLKNEVNKYFDDLDLLGLKDADIKDFKKKSLFTNILLLVFGGILDFPLFIYGALNYILPYCIAGLATEKMTPRPDFTGSLRLAAGTFATVIFYILQTIFIGVIFGFFPAAIFYLASLPICGIFAVKYAEWILKIKQRINLHILKKDKIVELRNERRNILDKLNNVIDVSGI